MIIKHFTATGIILDEDKALLIWHKKLGTWLPPGGHVEENELPNETLLREVKEEIGREIEIITDNTFENENKMFSELDKRTIVLPSPWRTVEVQIEEDHFHIDLLYLAKLKDSKETKSEDHKTKWFTIEDLKNEKDIYYNVKHHVQEAIKTGKKNKMIPGNQNNL